MSDIEQKARALLKEVQTERGYENLPVSMNRQIHINEALCRAIKRHEATKQEYSDFRQMVSDAVVAYRLPETRERGFATLKSFIIPSAKPDPLIAALKEVSGDYLNGISSGNRRRIGKGGFVFIDGPNYAKALRASLAARGLQILEVKSDD
jgi:hypothetical protein